MIGNKKRVGDVGNCAGATSRCPTTHPMSSRFRGHECCGDLSPTIWSSSRLLSIFSCSVVLPWRVWPPLSCFGEARLSIVSWLSIRMRARAEDKQHLALLYRAAETLFQSVRFAFDSATTLCGRSRPGRNSASRAALPEIG